MQLKIKTPSKQNLKNQEVLHKIEAGLNKLSLGSTMEGDGGSKTQLKKTCSLFIIIIISFSSKRMYN